MILVYIWWGIPVRTPAPSPESLSQPQAPRCSIRRNITSESRNTCNPQQARQFTYHKCVTVSRRKRVTVNLS